MIFAKRHILLMLCILFTVSLNAQQEEISQLELLPAQNGRCVLTFRLGDIAILSTPDGYATIQATGMTNLAPHEGLPALPQSSQLVMLPAGSSLTVDDIQLVQHRLNLNDSTSLLLAPFAGATAKDVPSSFVETDKEVYGSPSMYRAGAPVEIENLGVMGDQQLFRLTVHPMAYHPIDNTLSLITSLSATVTTSVHKTSVTPQTTSRPERFLLVARPEFREGLQPFVRWKRQQGYDVAELYTPTHLRDGIKEQINTFFSSSRSNEWPRYILLVGDVGQLQSFPGVAQPSGFDSHTTDLYYAEHTGDYLPDALIGRWPVNDTAQLDAVVRKTLRYEQGFNLDTVLLRRVILVAGAENQEPAPVTTNGQVNYLGHEIKASHPGLDTSCYRNPASANQRNAILNDIASGAALLNYTAHCTNAGWSTPNVTFSSIDTLTGIQPMVYVNNCCKSNSFSGTCFGEQLLRKPQGGAVGVIGATNSTLWNEDYYWAVGPKYPFSLHPVYDNERPGAFDCWLGRTGGVQTMGDLLVAGNMAVTAFGSPYDRFYWEIYCLLGDPSLMPWVGMPQPINLFVADSLPHDGDGTLHLGGTPGATVTAIQHDTLLCVGIIGDDGLLTLTFGHSLDTSPLILTATAYGHLPHIDTLTVQPATGVSVALRDIIVSDNAVECRVENIGSQPLMSLHITLYQPDADSMADALITMQQAIFDTLRPQESQVITLPVQVTAIGQEPFWSAQLCAKDSTEGVLICLTLRHMMNINYPSATFRLLENDGNLSHTLLPQHGYQLETTVDTNHDYLDLLLSALPTGDTISSLHSSLATLNSQFTTPDTLTHLHLQATLVLGNHLTNYDYYLTGGHRMDCFEEGLTSYPWQSGGTLPWIIDSTNRYSGRYSLRSGKIDYRQTSDLIIELLLPQPDSISFWLSTSTEPRYDKLIFSIDGRTYGNELWGETPWTRYAYRLTAGHHTLRWRYIKDESDSRGSDCVWLDDVTLPLALWDSAYGWFGNHSILGIDHVNPSPLSSQLSIYPNPTTGIVTVEGIGTLRILDLYGREVYSSRLKAQCSVLSLSFLPDGIYILHLADDSRHTIRKLIVRH